MISPGVFGGTENGGLARRRFRIGVDHAAPGNRSGKRLRKNRYLASIVGRRRRCSGPG
ncbi:hypothetical protein MCA0192 [Methylococcus capsulatus str. Bath]|uniref:Uncharacterized protein n=1 Tax=Methylococcus capsulatus (strain ATCC 33009 / NCIMB 11132 / Bath) TaxID=243233 RepID=Q60CB7_METCA|nr:hypothetical protein MCA0192 [Methylococcus capsulatus str. Bath]